MPATICCHAGEFVIDEQTRKVIVEYLHSPIERKYLLEKVTGYMNLLGHRVRESDVWLSVNDDTHMIPPTQRTVRFRIERD